MGRAPFNRSLLLLSTSLALGLGLENAALAAEATETMLEEIVVTSRLREERLQDVPVSVSVFTEQMIRDAGIEKPADFIALTPNVTMSDAQDAGNVAIVVRGIGQIRNGETPVAVAVDGVLQSSPLQFNQELFDIQQIEVLKGPQGALYGRNAIAGAINVTTKKPTNDFEGRAIFGYGNGDFIRGEGSVSGPLVEDKLLFRASVSHRQADGWITNTFLDKKVDDFKNQAANLRLYYIPNDKVNVDFRVSHAKTTGGAAYFVVASNANRNGETVISTADDVANIILPPTSNNLGSNTRKLTDVSLKVDVETDGGTFTSISAINWIDHLIAYDGYDYSDNTQCIDVGTPLYTNSACADPGILYLGFPLAAFNTTFQKYNLKDLSQEIRFTSPSDRKLRYIVGAYFLKRNRDLMTVTQEDLGFGIIPEIDTDPNTPNQTRSYFAEENRDKAYALFGQANYDITSQIEFALALRYDIDDREQTDPRPDAFRVDGYGFPITGDRTRSKKFKRLQPKISLTYKPTEAATLYINVADGFRSGGFNAPGTEVNPFTGDPVAESIYKKETSRNYEGGFKTQLLDRRLTLNGAVFYTDVKNLQVFNFNGAVNAQIVTTIDKVEIWGAELEAMARLGNGFSLFSGIGYADAEIKAFAANPLAVGNQVPYNTKFKFTLGGQYRGEIADGIELVARGDWEHRDKTYFHEGGNPVGIPVRDPLNFLSARVGIETESGWAVTVWGKNLTNKKYYEEVVLPSFAFQGRPRTYGVDLTKSF